MTTSTIAFLLQTAAALLTGATNSSLPASTTAAMVASANRSVQVAAQAMAPIRFAVPPNTGVWPTVADLAQSAYLAADGSYVPQGPQASLVQSSISFGDLNGDGIDDAAAIVTRPRADGSKEDVLAFFLDQGGVMFNIADLPLGASTTVYSHHVVNGVLVIDMQVQGSARATSTYALWGMRIVPLR